MNKSATVLLFLGSVSLIMVAIVFTAVVNRSNEGKSDVRARASQTGGIIMHGRVKEVDSATRTVIIDSLAFESSPDKNLGDGWKVTVKQQGDLNRFSPGTSVRFKAESSKLSISDKVIIALEIDRR